jgi:molybdopterin-guanine dinucleotide biosynthesis protein A
MTERRVSAIVLAGGRSSRFGRDKLVEPVGGRPLLDHAIDGVRAFATEVIVVLSTDAVAAVPLDVRVVHDPAPFEGPLAGLLAGLGAAREPVVLLTGGDMPELQPAVVEALLVAGASAGVNAAVLEEAGRARPLPMVVAREAALQAAEHLIDAGERSLRALAEVLTVTVVPEASWRTLDPAGRSLRDVDTPGDLR